MKIVIVIAAVVTIVSAQFPSNTFGMFPQTNFPQSNSPQSNFPQSNFPQSNYPYPQSNFPQSNFPQTNFPQTNFPQTNFPQTNFPQTNFPQMYYPQTNFPGNQQIYYPQTNFPLINPAFWRQCAQESRVTDDELNRFRNRDFTNPRENIYCFTNCILDRMGLILNGDISEQRVLQILAPSFPRDQITSRIAGCRQQSRGVQRCESSYRFYVCLSNSAGNSDIFRFNEIRK